MQGSRRAYRMGNGMLSEKFEIDTYMYRYSMLGTS
jgi:hypothetical protein